MIKLIKSKNFLKTDKNMNIEKYKKRGRQPGNRLLTPGKTPGAHYLKGLLNAHQPSCWRGEGQGMRETGD